MIEDEGTARGILEAARQDGRTALLENEVYSLLETVSLRGPRRVFWSGSPGHDLPADVAAFLPAVKGGDVVLKISSPDILHKSDVGGIAFVRADPAEVLKGARGIWEETGRLAPGACRAGILVAERLAPAGRMLASELFVSLKQDPAFGTVVIFGVGGLLTEWFSDLTEGRSAVILPPGRVRQGLERAATELPAFALLFRPSRAYPAPPLDLPSTAQRLETVARLATRFPPEGEGPVLEELEVNPVLLLPDGCWVAADGKGWISGRRARVGPRPLAKVSRLLSPRSAAVLGASASSLNPGRTILRNLKVSEGITYGHLWAVHPKETAIDGIPCVRTTDELPEPVDLAVVAIPAEGARDAVVSLCRSGKAESIIVIPGGFAETGRQDLEDEIRDALAASRSTAGGGPVLVGGNCLGIVSKHRYNTFFLPQYKLPFHDAPGDSLVAVSQSGAYLVSLTSNLDGIIFPRASISFGNQMDLTVADFLEYFETDESVRVLACYIEGFVPLDGERFVKAARRLRAKGKRVIAFKAGKTLLGAKATQSHTASLAGDYAVARALMEDAGVIVAQTLNMFEDYTKIFTMLADRIPPDRRVAILSNAGFECSAVLDKLYNLVPAELTARTKERLAAVLPDIAHADNPIDATPMAGTKAFVAAAEALLQDPGVDALIVSPIPVTPALDNLAPSLAGDHAENIYSPGSLLMELLRVFRSTKKPVVVNIDSGRLYDDFVVALQRGGIPAYRKIDRASRALSALLTA